MSGLRLEAQHFIELSSNCRGGWRVAILTERPLWNPSKGDPDRPGTFAIAAPTAWLGLPLEEIRALCHQPGVIMRGAA